MKPFLIGFTVWMSLSLIPFLFIGYQWGMVWYYPNGITGGLLKDHLEWKYPWFYVNVVTVLNALLFGAAILLLARVFARERNFSAKTSEL